MNNKKIIAYEFYHRHRNGEDQFIGSLTEKRKKPERITYDSIMNWAKFNALTSKDVCEEGVYCVQVEI